MSQHSTTESLSGAAALASLFLASTLGAEPGQLGAAGVIRADADRDAAASPTREATARGATPSSRIT